VILISQVWARVAGAMLCYNNKVGLLILYPISTVGYIDFFPAGWGSILFFAPFPAQIVFGSSKSEDYSF
jgi:hypothetical protein